MQNEGIPKQIATGTMEGTRKRGRPRKRWTEEAEDGLNVMGVQYRRAMARDRRELRNNMLEGKTERTVVREVREGEK